MADGETMATTPGDELQFDHAEYTGPAPLAPACAACRREIGEAYYEVNGLILCPGCRVAVGARPTTGQRLARFLRALAYGIGAAVAGFALYCGLTWVSKGTIWNIIAIFVGLMVGSAVRKGSRMRGGWAYQLLAIFLTYTTIGASYSAILGPELIKQVVKRQGGDAAGPAPGAPAAAPATPGKEVTSGVADEAEPRVAAKSETRAAAKPEAGDAVGPGAALVTAEDDTPPTPAQALIAVVVILVLAVALVYIMPILVCFGSPISILIIGFALWEAWKLNRRTPLVINGPFAVGGAAGTDPGGVVGHV